MAKPMGMMSGCYFVGRGELLEWLNSLLQIQYTKIEQTSNGAAFCQVLDAIHPGTVALGRVDYNAAQGFKTNQNYRVLQDALHKNNITQYIDFVTLAKGKYMIALESLQWIHGYYEQTGPHEPYEAAARRRSAKCADPKVIEEDPDRRH
jgi:RP/EB family microtubule-associated protein